MNIWQIILIIIYLLLIITFFFIETEENPQLIKLEKEINNLEIDYEKYNCDGDYLPENYENCLYLQEKINPLIDEYNSLIENQ